MNTNALSARLRRTLITGLLVVAPFSLTIMVLTWFVGVVNAALAPLVGPLGQRVPGLGLLAALVLVLAAGALANNIVGQHLLVYAEELLLKVPVFNWLYRIMRQIADAVSRQGKGGFRRVVLVEYPRPSLFRVGFVTNEVSLDRGRSERKLVCVYVPTNHMYIGDYILVPEDDVVATTLTLQEGIQCALSAGASLPEDLKGRGA